jgi:RecA-family ATPase
MTLHQRNFGISGDNPPDEDDERPLRGRRGRIKKLAKSIAAYDHVPDDWDDYVDWAEGEVSFEDSEKNLKKQGYDFIEAYDYTNQDGSPLYQVRRYHFRNLPGVKTFRIWRKDADGNLVAGAGPARMPYRLLDLIRTRGQGPVLICEGEKDTDRAIRQGLRATCAQGSNWSDDVTDYIAGEDVIIIPDNDDKGMKNAQKAVRWIGKVAATVRVLELDGLRRRGDLSDWFNIEGHNAEKLLALAERVTPEPIPGRLNVVSPADWQDKPIPERDWVVRDFIPADTVGFIYGDGGTGKSLLGLMLAVATASSEPKPWLGLEVRQGRTLYMSCEDDADELHRRLGAVRIHAGLEFSDLDAIRVVDLVGQDAVLGERMKDGTIKPTELLRAVAKQVDRHEADLVIIDSLANVFAGDENDRGQARQFVSMLGRLAVRGRAVVILAHPSLSGINTGRGTSGSTGWGNSGRWRAYFEKLESKDGAEDQRLRTLSLAKSNYGPADLKITVRWEDGVYVPVDGGTVTAEASRIRAIYWFKALLRRLSDQGRDVSHSAGKNYAPSIFAGLPEATERRITSAEFKVAMEALFRLEQIKIDEHGPPSRRRSRLVLVSPEELPSQEPF